MKIVLLGSDRISQAALVSTCAAGHIPELVVTSPKNSKDISTQTIDLEPVAKRYGVPVLHTDQVNSVETIQHLTAIKPDLVLVMGWPEKCSSAFLAIPRIGCLGFHPSALPRLRGRSVISWTVLLEEKDIGSSIFWLSDDICAGPIAAQARYAINPETITAGELHDRALRAITGLLPPLIDQISVGNVPREPQPQAGASRCRKLTSKDRLIRWSSTARDIERLVRATTDPCLGAFTYAPDGDKLTVRKAQKIESATASGMVPGQVIAVNGHTFDVACAENQCVRVLDWDGGHFPPQVHSQLGSGG